jgi:TPR repeat protein
MRAISRFLIILILVVVGPVAASAASVEEAKAATSRKDYPLAMRLWRELAEQENPRALFGVGIFYDSGWGVAKDQAEAAQWFLRAARRGHEGAQEALYHAYEKGLGIPVDHAEAEKWIRPLAEKGYPLPQVYLAGLNLRKQNLIETYKWLTLAKREKLSSGIASKGLENLRQK